MLTNFYEMRDAWKKLRTRIERGRRCGRGGERGKAGRERESEGGGGEEKEKEREEGKKELSCSIFSLREFWNQDERTSKENGTEETINMARKKSSNPVCNNENRIRRKI